MSEEIMHRINWRDSYRPARFFIFDGRLVLLVIPTLMFFRIYTIVPTLMVAAILYYFEKRHDMDVPSSIRMVRAWMVGKHRPARAENKHRRPVDFDRRDQPIDDVPPQI